MSDMYILDDAGVPQRAESTMQWGRWFEQNSDKRRVAFDQIDAVRVSTVFLGIDHAWDGGTPLLYETMIFEGPYDGWCERDTCREDALKTHEKAKQLAFGVSHDGN